MISIVFVELLPESIENSNIWVSIIGLVLGAFMVLGLNNLMDKISNIGKTKSKIHGSFEEYFHASDIISDMTSRKNSMLRSGHNNAFRHRAA
jgi:hypothetical protein